MPNGTSAPSRTSTLPRPAWRDRIKSSTLNPPARFVALLMADYWPKDGDRDLWCSVDTLIAQSGFSRATVYRAVGELKACGWLVQTQAATHNRSPRYAPTAPPQPEGSHSETAEVSDSDESVSGSDPTLDVLHTDTTVGPSDIGSRRGTKAPRKRTRTAMTEPESDRAWADLKALCREIECDPGAAWLTALDEGAVNPYNWVRHLVDAGQWDGYVASHGLVEPEAS